MPPTKQPRQTSEAMKDAARNRPSRKSKPAFPELPVTPMRAELVAALSRDGYPTDPRSLYAATVERFAARRAAQVAEFEAVSARANAKVEAQDSMSGPGRKRMRPLNGLSSDPVDALVNALPNRFTPTSPTLD